MSRHLCIIPHFVYTHKLKEKMTLNDRLQAFITLGKTLPEHSDLFRPTNQNTWFTEENIRYALQQTAEALSENSLRHWTSNYPEIEKTQAKRIGVILAGNIPLVGFHDFLSVLITGHYFIGKQSSKEDKLLQILAQMLIDIEPRFAPFVRFENEKLKEFDAVIATGSNNSARYFEYYFGKYPNIIRRNRNSLAVLSGTETNEQLQRLADDLFLYFGLGCRNVSKLFIPENFELSRIFENTEHYSQIINHNKYSNNYGYNRSIYLMNNVPFWDNNFFILTENTSYASPVSVCYFERYNHLEDVKQRLASDSELIQCIVSENCDIENSVAFGQSQKPQLHDYADGVDTMKFLTSL